MESKNTSRKLYEGLKVVEFTNNIAAPVIGQFLAEYRAEVIHVEMPVYGDDTRHYPPVYGGESLVYPTFNHGKKSVTLDLKDPDGYKIAMALCQEADVVMENYRPSVMDKLHLGYEDVHRGNPSVIYRSVSAYGQKGPYSQRPGYDLIAQGSSGFMYYNGDDETGPVKAYTEIGDYCASLTGFGAINAALYYREKTGVGQQLDIAMVRALAYVSSRFDDYLVFHRKTKKMGSQGARFAPYGVYKCPDGQYVIIACINDNVTFRFFRAIGREDLTTDPRFATVDDRVAHSQEVLYPIVMDWINTMGTADAVGKFLNDLNIPCTKVYSFEDVANDPHYNECGWLVDIPLPDSVKGLDSRRVVKSPYSFSELTPEFERLEGFGAANHEIIGRLGYTDAQIDALQEKWEQAILNPQGK